MSMHFRVEIEVMPKTEVADPQGQAVAGAAERFFARTGMPGAVHDVRIGKVIVAEIEAAGPEAARVLAEALSDKLLANHNTEQFRVRSIDPATHKATR